MPTQKLILPVWEKSALPVRTVQGEAESRIVQVTLADADGTPVDLTGASARLYVRKPDGGSVFLDGMKPGAADGICSFLLPSGVTAEPGIAYAQILAAWSDGRSLKADGLILEVEPSDLEETVEASDSFPALTAALGAVQQTSETASQAAADAQQAVADAQTAISGANAAAGTANAAAISANNSADAANTAAQDAAQLYRMTDPLTGQAANVTDIVDSLTAYIFRDAVTAQQMDDLNKTAQDFDALTISAANFDTSAKITLGVA